MKENQEFKSSSMLLVLGLGALSLGVVAIPWNNHIQSKSTVLAVQKAEVAGYQIAQLYREAAKSKQVLPTNGRMPASIGSKSLELRETGTVGKDPWGAPYHYRFLGKQGEQIRVLIWSQGPNKKVDTLNLDNEEVLLVGQPEYQGDDIGVVLTVK